jgi:UDP-N-acetylmuramoylalanine--D-glutamate ligase
MKKKLVILGAGESGVGTALLAIKQGYEVFVSDGGKIKEEYKNELKTNGIDFEELGHAEEKILNADEVMKSPGIPEKNELVKKIRQKGISIISEIEFAFRYKGDSRIIAITGSNGKTTTTALTWHICKNAGMDCAMVGNIGYSFARQLALDPKSLYVIEISSFQLDDIKTFRPDVAILTNITEDHLDRYDYKMQNYVDSKFRIVENQQVNDVFIFNLDDTITNQNINKYSIQSTLYPDKRSDALKMESGGNAYEHRRFCFERKTQPVQQYGCKFRCYGCWY